MVATNAAVERALDLNWIERLVTIERRRGPTYSPQLRLIP